MTDDEILAKLSKVNQRYYKMILEAATSEAEWPANTMLGGLIDRQLIRVETYVNGNLRCRVITLLSGQHSGKKTKVADWVKEDRHLKTIDDSRPIDVVHGLGLLTHQDLADVTLGRKPAQPTLNTPEWLK